jgi:hypothetical protein
MAISSRAKIWTEFERMRIKHPRLDEAHAAFDDLRAMKLANPLAPQRFASMFAPTHSGKSMAVRTYIENVVVDQAISRGLFRPDEDRALIAKKQKLVLHISLEGVTGTKSLATDILTKLEDDDPSGGTGPVLLQRSYDQMDACKTELLVVDEIQHLSPTAREKKRKSYREKADEATSVTNTLKVMMIRGLVPMVFVGIDEGKANLFNDRQLAERCLHELDFGRLEYTDAKERKIFEDYCGRLGLKLKQHGLFDQPSNFLDGDIAPCLHEITGGRIGAVSRFIEKAAVIAAKENAEGVTREHLVRAADETAKEADSIGYNPFRGGIRLKRTD